MSCPRCQEGTMLPGEPAGSIEADFNGAYFAPAPKGAENKKRTILLLSDGFGLPLKNSKILADNFAERLGCDVWIPDYFEGRPLLPLDTMRLPERAGDPFPWWKMMQFILTMLFTNFGAVFHNLPAKTERRVNDFIHLIKEKRGYEKIGAVGYCYGGSTCIRLGNKADLVQSIVIIHPGGFSVDTVRGFTIPSSWALAEDEPSISRKLKDETEAHLRSRNDLASEYKVYKGTAHGFACRPNFAYPEVKEGYEQAFEQTVAWFGKTLSGQIQVATVRP